MKKIIIPIIILLCTILEINENYFARQRVNSMKEENSILQQKILINKWKKYTKRGDRTIYPNLKIFVSYDKPYTLWQHPFLTPIHVGRAIKQNDWLEKNMIGDNTGDNISIMNKKFGEMTIVYWTWKHYNEIGNPPYIGFFQHNKFIDLDVTNDAINHDMVVAEKIKVTLKNFNYVKRVIKKTHPEILNFIKQGESYANSNTNIMKKEIFFEYCEWIFPILFEMEKEIEGDNDDFTPIIETLNGVFFDKKIKDEANVKTTIIINN
ncbi:MAG: DUF4422 domain-containing protein [Rickettsiales bacterium]|jgi:hypothetical protein|nr:DUF4422 domain-containing protein [Rickettsiales bacterium]